MPRIDFDAIEDEWEDDDSHLAGRARNLSVAARRRIEQLDVARVVAVDRGRVTIDLDGDRVEASLAGTMRGAKAAVGDRVRVRRGRDDDTPRIVEVLDRDTVLLRTGDDAQDDERVVVANADRVVVVISADHPHAGVRLLDRVMVAASAGGLDTLLCVNKMDLVDDRPAIVAIRDRYTALDVAVQSTCALTGEGVDELAEALRASWSAFIGHSGVGKSSLFNRLVPDAEHAVGEVGRRGGRHTTVASRAMRVDALDAWLVDTPGLRSFGLGIVAPRDLPRHFPELADLACALDDCVHDGEPGCALDPAEVHPDRLTSYRRLLQTLREGS